MDVIGVYGKGLYCVAFGTYGAARQNLEFLGWVEFSRSSSQTGEPSEVRFFNKLVGGDGRLYREDDGTWVFLAADGWLMAVYKKLRERGELRSPSEDARLLKRAQADTTRKKGVLDLFGDTNT